MNLKLTLIAAAALLTAAMPAGAAIVGPYTADTNTVHLWHLDQTSGDYADSATGGDDLENVSGVTRNATAFTGFGNAAQLPADSAYVSNSGSTSGTGYQGADGAFTIEALVNLSSISVGDEQYIFGRRIGAPPSSGYEFRIVGGNLQLLIFTSGSDPTISAAIPTTGDHAFEAGEWFHVAATYNGDAGAADSVGLYWTRLDEQFIEANLIGTGVGGDAGTGSTTTFLGNRSTSAGEGLLGSMDEVRVSDVARGANEMMFVPEPATLGLLAVGGLALAAPAARRRRRKA